MIEASAPARAGVIGNPTDGYGGSLISCTLGARANVRLSPCERIELCLRVRRAVHDSQ